MNSQRTVSSITDVKDSKGKPVDNGESTDDPLLTVYGGGTASSVVFVYDNGDLLTTASVTINRTWDFTDTFELGRHVFTVRDSLAGVDSPEWVVTVGSAELDLPEPTVSQAPGGILNPIDAINGATVVVTYAMQTTDTIGISWNGQDNLVPTQPGSTLGSVTFTIPDSAVATVIGKTIPVLYAVVRNGVAKPSTVLNLTVQTLSDSVLEAPRILQATNDGSLDVSALTGDVDLRVKPWPFIAAGQRISLRFEGTKADGSAYNWSHPTWQNLPISSTGEPSTTVALSSLNELKAGSNLVLVFEVSFGDGTTNVSFPARLYKLVTYLRTENFDLLPYRQFLVGTIVETPVMTLRFLSGEGYMTIAKYPHSSYPIAPVPGQMEGNALTLCLGALESRPIPQTLEVKPRVPCSRVSFYYTWLDNDMVVRFYDSAGNVILEKVLPHTESLVALFDESVNRRIERMEITVGDWSCFDYFSFYG
ncbi:hypothetical protein [Pseudomonas folii]|uniref:Uncharacterized protein n=1 Tax=Pseudomonas folii TaxID=2762593 RepID=A0ABR7B1G6_9PSED|nr:hypothetical protein [Pseudomonas folii]MBC3950977.1 hypothetical protein [Pseudomonas folii]